MNATTFAHVMQLIALTASAVILWRTEPAINLMGPRCQLAIRIAFWLLAVGSVALILIITQGYRPKLPVVLVLCGLALLLVNERRIKGLLRMHTPVKEERRAEP